MIDDPLGGSGDFTFIKVLKFNYISSIFNLKSERMSDFVKEYCRNAKILYIIASLNGLAILRERVDFSSQKSPLVVNYCHERSRNKS